MTSAESWMRVTAERPCPVCGKPDWCLLSRDGTAAICPRVEFGAERLLGEAGWLHRLTHEPRQQSEFGLPQHTWRAAVTQPATRRNLRPLIEQSKHRAADAIEELATSIKVTTHVLNRLEVGYSPYERCWMIPEKDGRGNIIGIQRRFRDGSQRRLAGTQAGLTYPSDWDTGTGPVILVEGASDVAAAMLLELSVIGRPSNRGGCTHLTDMLAAFPETRPIIVLGERDQKENGSWPGREGAIQTATTLAARLVRPVQWALPPDEAKDLRAWVNQFEALSPQRMRTLFLDGLQLQTIDPPPIQRAVVDQRAEISAANYRAEMRSLRMRSLDRPGVYLDRSGTGHGKSSLDFELLRSELTAEWN